MWIICKIHAHLDFVQIGVILNTKNCDIHLY